MKEIWKDIPNYEGIYQASSFGNIKSTENPLRINTILNQLAQLVELLSAN